MPATPMPDLAPLRAAAAPGPRSAPAPTDPHHFDRLIRGLRAAVVLSVVLPAVLFAALALDRRLEVGHTAEALVARRADLAAAHAARVLEIQETTLEQIDLLTRGMSWNEIERGHGVSLLLKDFADRREHIASAWIADATGLIRAGSLPWRTGLNIEDRDFFLAQRAGDPGVFIGEPFVGRTTGLRSFGVSRRRTTADGSFDDTIHIAVAAGYFETFFAAFPGERQVAALIRTDGAVLARSPPAPELLRLGSASPLMARIAEAAHGAFWGRSTVDGARRVYAFRQVGAYPVFAGFGVDAAEIFAEWRSVMVDYGLLSLVLTVLLVAACIGLLDLARRARAGAALALVAAERDAAAQRIIDALERQNAVSRVVAGVAHEFNNLLTPIMMGAELMRDRTTDEEQRRTLTSMIAGAERGARLVADLMSHIQNQFLRIEPVALRPAIDETLALFSAGRRPEVQVTLAAEQDVPQALADRRQFQLALTHLLDNADAALPEGGTIAVRLLGPGAGHRHLSVVVQDNGTGMAPEVLAQAREPFFTTAAYRERPGLGLSMVSGFMRQIGGELVIESLPGWGTRAEMRLPVASG